jgi:hypothetical protein
MLTSALLKGMAAGAAGTTALNAATYTDMAARARPASEMPQRAVESIAAKSGYQVPGEGDERENRLSGLGALSGILTGVGVGAVAGLLSPILTRLPTVISGALLGGAAMAGSDVPLTKLGLTDPSSWSAKSWASDVAPHLAYGLVTALTLRALHRSSSAD